MSDTTSVHSTLVFLLPLPYLTFLTFPSPFLLRREKLEDSRRFQYFKRDADELETWIHEKLSTAAEESFKDTTNLQAKIQKHQAFEAEVITD